MTDTADKTEILLHNIVDSGRRRLRNCVSFQNSLNANSKSQFIYNILSWKRNIDNLLILKITNHKSKEMFLSSARSMLI